MTSSVSIIVLNWNGKHLLRRCLKTMRTTAYDDFHLVVVDNGSTDGSLEMVRTEFGGVDLVEINENVGFSKGNNVGIEYVLGEHDPDQVLLLNNDIEVVDPQWLDYLVESANRDDVGIVGCKLLYPNGDIQHAGGRVRYSGDVLYRDDRYQEPKVLDRLEFVLGACFMIDRDVIEKIGFLDEGFSPINWEETDYCMRCRAAGYEVVYDPRSELVHHEKKAKEQYGNTESEASLELNYYHKKNQIRFMLLNFSVTELLRRVPTEFREFIGCFLRRDSEGISSLPGSLHVREGPLKQLGIFLKSFAVNVENLPEILSKRNDRTRYIEGAGADKVNVSVHSKGRTRSSKPP